MFHPKTRLLAALTSAVVAIGIFSASAGAAAPKPAHAKSHGKSDCRCPKGTTDPNYCEVEDDHAHESGHGHSGGHRDDRGHRRGARS
jgi:hypothetical protein